MAKATAQLVVLFSAAVLCSSAYVAAQTPAAAPAARLPATFWMQFHRGAGRVAPENTLSTFELAWGWGGVPEADVRQTKDGVLVAFHDGDFSRLVFGASAELKRQRIEDLAFEEVARLDVGRTKGESFAGQRVPAMRDVFAAMQGHPERRIYLDEKDAPLEPLAQLVAQFRLESQVVLASTRYERLRLWKQMLPASNTLHWMGGPQAELAKRLAALAETQFADITQLQIHVRIGDLKSLEPFSPSSHFLRSVANQLRPRGILFQVLPLDQGENRAVYGRLLDLGVQSFATDNPQEAVEAVCDYLQQHR